MQQLSNNSARHLHARERQLVLGARSTQSRVKYPSGRCAGASFAETPVSANRRCKPMHACRMGLSAASVCTARLNALLLMKTGSLWCWCIHGPLLPLREEALASGADPRDRAGTRLFPRCCRIEARRGHRSQRPSILD